MDDEAIDKKPEENTKVILEKIRSGKIVFTATEYDPGWRAGFVAYVGSHKLELRMYTSSGECAEHFLCYDGFLMSANAKQVYELVSTMEEERMRLEKEAVVARRRKKNSEAMAKIRAL